ncbi:MAG: hypothetical protein ACLTG4_10040 [Oscillospiraceae bacterium]
MTLFAFEQDEEISTHTADSDALHRAHGGALHHRRRGAPSAGKHRHAGDRRTAHGADALQMLLTVIV